MEFRQPVEKNARSFFSFPRGLFRSLHQEIGIDLGTANTVFAILGKGIILSEPSVVAIRVATQELVAIGKEAKKMIGKAPRGMKVIRPMRHGVIADFDAARLMLQEYVSGIIASHPLASVFKPLIVVGVPSMITDVERRAVQSAALSAGAGKVSLIEEPMAAAIGAGIQVMKPEGRMIVDVGGGTTEIAVVSLGGIVANRSVKVAGDAFDDAVRGFVQSKYNVVIGEATAEQTKIEIGSAYPFEEKKSFQHVVRGRDAGTGLPTSVKISSVDLREAITPVVQHILSAIAEVLEETPPELLADIVEQGIVLAGGGSQLRGLEQRISEEMKMPVWTTKDPQHAVIRGCETVLKDHRLLERVRVRGGL